MVVLAAIAVLVSLFGAGSYALAARSAESLASRAVDNAGTLLAVEAALGLDVERVLQESPLGGGVIGGALAIVYALAYWPFVIGALALTVWRDRPSFRLLRNALLISGAIGLAVISVFPVAPPRLLDGYDDGLLGAGPLRSLAHPDGWFNPHAALPSFHVGWMVLAAVGLRRCGLPASWRWTPPALMTVAVVVTGNHYVLDVVAGVALAATAWALAGPMQRAIDDRRPRNRRRAPPDGSHRPGGWPAGTRISAPSPDPARR